MISCQDYLNNRALVQQKGKDKWIRRVTSFRNSKRAYGRAIPIKIAVVGDSGVGKTCFVKTFSSGRKSISSSATVGFDMFTRTMYVDNEKVKLKIWEPSGQERFHDAIPQQCLRDCHAVIFCYDPTHYKSLINISQTWMELVTRRVKREDCVRILVECKNDLLGCQCPERGPYCRPISAEEKEVAIDMLGLDLFKTSVVTSTEQDLEAPFRFLARRVVRDETMMEEIKEDVQTKVLELNEKNLKMACESGVKEKPAWKRTLSTFSCMG